MQYSIPQFIDTEDRIIGPLTLKQFLWLLAGGGILTLVWMIIKNTGINIGVFVVIAVPIISFFLAMAFVRVNGRPLVVFLTNLLVYFLRPRSYIWRREYEKHHEPKMAIHKEKKEGPPKKEYSQSRIAELAWVLDTGGNTKSKTKI